MHYLWATIRYECRTFKKVEQPEGNKGERRLEDQQEARLSGITLFLSHHKPFAFIMTRNLWPWLLLGMGIVGDWNVEATTKGRRLDYSESVRSK